MSKKGFFSIQSAATNHYPFKPLSPQYLRIIEEAIRFSWRELVAAPQPHGIHSLLDSDVGEVAISEALLRVLCGIQEAKERPVPAFSEHFEAPTSDAGLRNFSGNVLGTRVDFCFRLKINPYPGTSKIYNGLFVEAKLIRQDGSLSGYMGGGLIKFLRGDYAWAMPHAMMLAYLRQTSQTLPNALNSFFDRLGNTKNFQLKSPARTSPVTRYLPRAYKTVHGRTWNHPAPHNQLAGHIEIIHLWLNIA